jgi:uncharacterized membrane protein
MVENTKVSSRQLLVLILLICVGGFFRFYEIGGPSLWLDEFWSLEVSTGRGSMHDALPADSIQTRQFDLTSLSGAPPWWKIWTTLTHVAWPPLYHITLRWWMDGLGNSATAIRSLSALFSLVAVLVFFDICRLLHGTQTALWGAALMTFSVAQLEFAQDARSYAMLMAFGLLACDAMVRIELRGADSTRLIALGSFVVIAQLTHYFAALAIGGLAVYAIIRLRGRNRSRALATIVAAELFCVGVWGREFLAQMRYLSTTNLGHLQEKSGSPLVATLKYLIVLPGKFFCGDDIYSQHPHAAMVATVIGLVIVAPLPIFYLATRRRDMLIWIVWLCAIVGVMTLVDVSRRTISLYYLRYSILASPAVFAMVAGFRKPVAMVALIVCAYLAVVRAVVGVSPRGDWRQYADTLDENVAPDQVVAFYYHDPYLPPGMWYLAMRYSHPESNRPWVLIRKPMDEALQSELRARGTFWLVSDDPAGFVKKFVPGWNPGTVIRTPVASLYQLFPAPPLK